MPLRLITGPANAAKAGVVLEACRAAATREPLLVVPTFADVETYRRELAIGGAVLGVRIERFGGLLRELAFRAGIPGEPLGRLALDRVAALAIAKTPLERLAASAATSGFVPALVRFADELASSRIDPPRLIGALRDWAGVDESRRIYANELGALYAAYVRILEHTGRRDQPGHTHAALDALRLAPFRWGRTPVFLYGFDDLTALQRDVIETLANHARAEVTLSLTFEPGRTAFAARADLYHELLALGANEERLPALPDHYAHAVLHHLERGLFEDHLVPNDSGTPRSRPQPGPAVLALEGGGERAEVELVAAHVVRLIRQEGVAPHEIAVVHRDLREVAPLIEQVFRAYDIPIAMRRELPAGHTTLGRGIVALLRCALLDGSADDLVAWLRTPGLLRVPALADRLEVTVRRQGLRTAKQAREVWEHEHWPLETLDHVVAAYERGGLRALGRRLGDEAMLLLAAPWRRQAPVFDHAGQLEARVAGTLRGALRELSGLPRDLQPNLEELASTLETLRVFVGSDPGPGLVTVSRPQDLRARRVRALLVLGLQEGVFPAPARPDPFLGDVERREVNTASGLRLTLHDNGGAVERLFFYASVSRPTDLLALSWHSATDDGVPAVRSPLVDDVADLLSPTWVSHPERRELGAAGWLAERAPTEREAARFAACAAPPAEPTVIAPLHGPASIGALRGRHTWSASSLEAWAACPVRWFVERLLRPESLVPDPEPMIRGSLAHRVLERAISVLAQGDGLVPDRLPEARRLVRAALDEHAQDFRISTNPERLRSALRRLEVDLVRYIEHAAHSGSAFRPDRFEVTFGSLEDDLPPLELGGGVVRLQGRIDRIDRGPGDQVIVYDYKGKSAPPGVRWLQDGKFQVGLYLLAVRHVLGLEPVGGFYQPLGTEDARPRGALISDADPSLGVVHTDRLGEAEFEQLLEDCATAAREVVEQIRAGSLTPNPASCAYGGGCAHPTICRCVTA